MGWQPIETAPKDGTVIDVWLASTREWRPPDGEAARCPDVKWMDGRGWCCFDDEEGSWLSIEDRYWSVTHWMPIPSPPARIGMESTEGKELEWADNMAKVAAQFATRMRKPEGKELEWAREVAGKLEQRR